MLHLVVTVTPKTLAEASFALHCASASFFLALITKLESTEKVPKMLSDEVVHLHV
jgi:hypothetical protein